MHEEREQGNEALCAQHQFLRISVHSHSDVPRPWLSPHPYPTADDFGAIVAITSFYL